MLIPYVKIIPYGMIFQLPDILTADLASVDDYNSLFTWRHHVGALLFIHKTK